MLVPAVFEDTAECDEKVPHMLDASGSLVCLHSVCSSSRSPQQLSTFSRRCCKPSALPARSQHPGLHSTRDPQPALHRHLLE